MRRCAHKPLLIFVSSSVCRITLRAKPHVPLGGWPDSGCSDTAVGLGWLGRGWPEVPSSTRCTTQCEMFSKPEKLKVVVRRAFLCSKEEWRVSLRKSLSSLTEAKQRDNRHRHDTAVVESPRAKRRQEKGQATDEQSGSPRRDEAAVRPGLRGRQVRHLRTVRAPPPRPALPYRPVPPRHLPHRPEDVPGVRHGRPGPGPTPARGRGGDTRRPEEGRRAGQEGGPPERRAEGERQAPARRAVGGGREEGR